MGEDIQHDAQVTSAHVLEALSEFKTQVNGRFDTLQRDVEEVRQTQVEAGLNGHTPLLKAFLEQYAATYVSRQAWQTVRSDLRHRLRFLAPSKRWIAILFGSIIGAIGWNLVERISGVHITPPF